MHSIQLLLDSFYIQNPLYTPTNNDMITLEMLITSVYNYLQPTPLQLIKTLYPYNNGTYNPSNPMPTNTVEGAFYAINTDGTIYNIPVNSGQYVLFLCTTPLSKYDIILSNTAFITPITLFEYDIYKLLMILLEKQLLANNTINSGIMSTLGANDTIQLGDFLYKKGSTTTNNSNNNIPLYWNLSALEIEYAMYLQHLYRQNTYSL